MPSSGDSNLWGANSVLGVISDGVVSSVLAFSRHPGRETANFSVDIFRFWPWPMNFTLLS